MPKIQIDIPLEAYEKLKEYAKEDERSLNKYITRGAIYLSTHPYHVLPATVTSTGANNTSTGANNTNTDANIHQTITTITKTKTAPAPLIPKKKRRNLLKEARTEKIFPHSSDRVHRGGRRPLHERGVRGGAIADTKLCTV